MLRLAHVFKGCSKKGAMRFLPSDSLVYHHFKHPVSLYLSVRQKLRPHTSDLSPPKISNLYLSPFLRSRREQTDGRKEILPEKLIRVKYFL